mgnify:CR=1 FL=1
MGWARTAEAQSTYSSQCRVGVAAINWAARIQPVRVSGKCGAIVSDLLGRLVSYADALLSELFTNATSIRLMEHAAQLDLEDFEDPDLQDKLDRARRQTMGRMNLMSQLFGQVQDAITVVSFAAGLLVYAPWLIALLALALVPAFIGESHFNAAGYSLNFQWTPERRQLDYLRQVGASVETAKEVKIFNLHRFLIDRYKLLADRFFHANRALARKRAFWGTLLAALGTLVWRHPLADVAAKAAARSSGAPRSTASRTASPNACARASLRALLHSV